MRFSTYLATAVLVVFPIVTHAQVISPYTVIAIHSGSPIHLESLAASNQAFYVGGSTSSSCPLRKGCPPGDVTAFKGGNGTLHLDVEVHGGQKVYIRSNGSLGFTVAHSDRIPHHAKLTGFSYNPGTNLGDLGVPGGFQACPTSLGYQVFAQVAGGNFTECIGFDAVTSNYTGGYAAYKYD